MNNEIITHKFRELLLPTILIAMALNITSIIDSSFVANFIGHNGQAALQVLEPLVLLISIFEWLFGLGGQILCLNKKSEFDEDGSNHYFTTAMLTTAIVSILIILVCLLFEDALIAILHPPSADLIPYVKTYGKYLFISFPIVTLMGVFSQFIRVDGQPNFSSAVIIIANIINIILDYLFLGVFHMGIEFADSLAARLAVYRDKGFAVVSSQLDGEPFFSRKPITEPVILIVGNEGNGVSDEVKMIATHRYRLPMRGEAESLNVAVAAGIMMYDLTRNLPE